MKQMKNDVKEDTTAKPQRKKPGIFSSFQDNPLRKYAPKPQPAIQPQNDGNSSSILIEVDDIATSEIGEKADEMTFKKVAEMLNEIQRLVVPGKPPQEEAPKEVKSPKMQYAILRHLASSYLTPEEMEFYQVEKELNEMDES
jgi:hypothetical protein